MHNGDKVDLKKVEWEDGIGLIESSEMMGSIVNAHSR